MSYDYMFFRLRKPISSHRDLSEETLGIMGSGDEIKAALSTLFPDMEWSSRTDDGAIWGTLPAMPGRCEFLLDKEPSFGFSLLGSYRADYRAMVEKICDAMGVIAFDGQQLELIGSLDVHEP